MENENLKVLDLSSNSLGKGQASCADEIGAFLRKN
jgi:hypothetical protein